MTGNVAYVFVAGQERMTTLRACRDALRPDGQLVFEVRDPTKEAWKVRRTAEDGGQRHVLLH